MLSQLHAAAGVQWGELQHDSGTDRKRCACFDCFCHKLACHKRFTLPTASVQIVNSNTQMSGDNDLNLYTTPKGSHCTEACVNTLSAQPSCRAHSPRAAVSLLLLNLFHIPSSTKFAPPHNSCQEYQAVCSSSLLPSNTTQQAPTNQIKPARPYTSSALKQHTLHASPTAGVSPHTATLWPQLRCLWKNSTRGVALQH